MLPRRTTQGSAPAPSGLTKVHAGAATEGDATVAVRVQPIARNATTTSSAHHARGGNGTGAVRVTPVRDSVVLSRFRDGRGQRGHDLEDVAHDPVVRDLEDRRVLVLVDRDDRFRRAHAGE